MIGFVLLLGALNTDSIDMMESQTWDYARIPTFPAFCKELTTDSNAEAQMPMAMFSFWAWARAAGTGELAMRSLNLLWAAIALAALARAGRQLSLPWLPLLFAIQPFVWYYMNYARTPLMQMAGGALLLAGALGYVRKTPQDGMDGILLCLGAVLLSGASMFGLTVLFAVAIGLAAHGVWGRLRLPMKGKILLFSTLSVIAVLGAYYISSLLHGSGGSPIWTLSPANIFFVIYEFLGFQGLGPGRQELRFIIKGLEPARELLPFLPGLLILAMAYFVILAASFKSWLTRDHHPVPAVPMQEKKDVQDFPLSASSRGHSLIAVWLMGLGVPALSAVILFLVAWVAGITFWGWHLAGALPFWVLALAVTMHWGRQGLWRKTGRLAGRILILILLTSSLLLRFAPFHRHDDYRGAVAEALRISRTGRDVWWVADYSGGVYYGLPLVKSSSGRPGEIQFAMNLPDSSGQQPGTIIISRQDNFDVHGTASRLIATGAYKKVRQLQAFEVWER